MLRGVLVLTAVSTIGLFAACSKKEAAENTLTNKTPSAPGPVPIPYPIVGQPSASQSPAPPKLVK